MTGGVQLLVSLDVSCKLFAASAMTSHRILITTEYLIAHFLCVFVFALYLPRRKCYRRYLMQIFINSVERLNILVYSAPPVHRWNG